MYASKSFNHRRTIDAVLSRRESYAARTALRKCVERATDTELRLAVRGTWIELELSSSDDDSANESNGFTTDN